MNFHFIIHSLKKPRIKHLKNIDLLHQLPFYDALNTKKILKTFRRYARNYKIEIIDSKDPSSQLEASMSSVKDFFKDLLNEIRGFKYQITAKVLSR